MGVSLPGAYNSADDRVNSARLPEINTVNIRESIHSVLNLPICLLEQDIKLAATSNITLVPDYQKKVISYLYIGESIDAATISQGQLLYGANFLAGQICALPMGSGTTVGKIIEESQNQEDIADVLVYIIRVLCCVIDPHEIIIECDRYKLSNGYLDMLTEQLSGHACFTNRSMPKISLNQGSIKHAHRGLVMKLRDMWVDSLN